MRVTQRSAPFVAALLVLGALGLAGLPVATAKHADPVCQDVGPFGAAAAGILDEETPVMWFHRTATSPTTLYLLAATSDGVDITVLAERSGTDDGTLCDEALCGTVSNSFGLATCEGDAPGDHWIRVQLAAGETGPVAFVVTPLAR